MVWLFLLYLQWISMECCAEGDICEGFHPESSLLPTGQWHSVVGLQFPSTLLTLNFGSNFNQSLENVTFPEADLRHPWYQVGLW